MPNWPLIKQEAMRPENYISGNACDHYNRFRGDFDIAKQLGHNAHRFSIEWSRIEPEEGKFDEKEIEHYAHVVAALRERGMEPFVTLWHWTLPLWLRDKGGVESKKFPDYFVRYCEKIVAALPDVRFWMTLNEPVVIVGQSYARSEWPPQRGSIAAARRVFHMLARAHREAYPAIHHINPDAQVGFGNAVYFFELYRPWHPMDRLSVAIAKYISNAYFFQLTGREAHDYIALQYYSHKKIAFPWKYKNENKKISDMGWELYPEGLYHLIKEWSAFNLPIYITENGLADANDINRDWYLNKVYQYIKAARDEGVDVRGYFHWSLLDNFEWDKGFWPRFGLVAVDYATQRRIIRPSAWAYKEIIEVSKQ